MSRSETAMEWIALLECHILLLALIIRRMLFLSAVDCARVRAKEFKRKSKSWRSLLSQSR